METKAKTDLLTTQEVADRYGVPLKTVRKWRSDGYGPRGFTVGRYVRYRVQDCIAWEEAQLQGQA
jgi:DNA-binding transcriptional MerR regulator